MCLAATIVVAAISVFTTGARADGSWCAMYGTVETRLSSVKPRFQGLVASAGRLHSTARRTDRDDIGDNEIPDAPQGASGSVTFIVFGKLLTSCQGAPIRCESGRGPAIRAHSASSILKIAQGHA